MEMLEKFCLNENNFKEEIDLKEYGYDKLLNQSLFQELQDNFSH